MDLFVCFVFRGYPARLIYASSVSSFPFQTNFLSRLSLSLSRFRAAFERFWKINKERKVKRLEYDS